MEKRADRRFSVRGAAFPCLRGYGTEATRVCKPVSEIGAPQRRLDECPGSGGFALGGCQASDAALTCSTGIPAYVVCPCSFSAVCNLLPPELISHTPTFDRSP